MFSESYVIQILDHDLFGKSYKFIVRTNKSFKRFDTDIKRFYIKLFSQSNFIENVIITLDECFNNKEFSYGSYIYNGEKNCVMYETIDLQDIVTFDTHGHAFKYVVKHLYENAHKENNMDLYLKYYNEIIKLRLQHGYFTEYYFAFLYHCINYKILTSFYGAHESEIGYLQYVAKIIGDKELLFYSSWLLVKYYKNRSNYKALTKLIRELLKYAIHFEQTFNKYYIIVSAYYLARQGLIKGSLYETIFKGKYDTPESINELYLDILNIKNEPPLLGYTHIMHEYHCVFLFSNFHFAYVDICTKLKRDINHSLITDLFDKAIDQAKKTNIKSHFEYLSESFKHYAKTLQ